MQIGFLRKYVPECFTFRVLDDGLLHSSDVTASVEQTDDLFIFNIDADREDCAKVLLYPEGVYKEMDGILLKLDKQGWEGMEFELTEWNYELIVQTLKELTNSKERK